MESPNPFAGMSPSELGMRYPSLYPPSEALPRPSTPTSAVQDGLAGLSPNELAKSFPQYYPDGPSGRIPNMPSAGVPDPIQSMSPAELAQRFPSLYPDAPKVAPLPSGFGDAPILPEIPKSGVPGAGLGNFLSTPAGMGVAGGVLTGLAGIATGQPLEEAAGAGLGAGLGGYGGAVLGLPFGPAGVLIGSGVGSMIGGMLGGNLGRSLHDFFHPPDSIHPPLPPPRKQFPPFTGSRYTLYRVKATGKFKNRPMDRYENVFLGPLTGLRVDDNEGLQVYSMGFNGGSESAIYMAGASDLIEQPLTITSVVPVDGSKDPTTAPPIPLAPNYEKMPGRGVPFGVDFGPSYPPQHKIPDTLPQMAPVPTLDPKTEPHKPPIGISLNPPRYNPAPADPKAEPESPPGPNLNNLPGLFGLPFIPAVMPSNRPSPPGSLDIDPGNGPTGTGKPPKAPTNSPCQGACQRAIEGRIQGVDDKVGKLLQGGNNAAQDAALAAILARLAVIDAKLGAQATGGLSGFLAAMSASFERLAKWLHLDRILNVLTFATTLHNAYMLSNALTQTLFSMLSNVLSIAGIKDKDGSPIDIGSIIGKTVESYAKSVLGVETVDGIKKEWKKYSRIYQAAANIVYSIQSIGFSILSALEVIGSMVGKIGNALKAGGAIFERAFGWMNIQPNFQNRFFTNIQAATDLVSNLDSVAGEVITIQELTTNLGTQKSELDKALTDQEKVDNASQKAVKDADARKPEIKPEHEQKPEV